MKALLVTLSHSQYQRRRGAHTATLLAVALLVAACSDSNEPDDHGHHAEVNEAIIRSGGVELSRTYMLEERWIPDTLVMSAGSTPLRPVFLGFDNAEFELGPAGEHYLIVEVDGGLTWAAADTGGTLTSTPGATGRLRLIVWHDDHSDYTSPWLSVKGPAPVVLRR